MIHWRSPSLKCSASCADGRGMFTIVASRTTMSWGAARTARTSRRREVEAFSPFSMGRPYTKGGTLSPLLLLCVTGGPHPPPPPRRRRAQPPAPDRGGRRPLPHQGDLGRARRDRPPRGRGRG